MQLKNKIIGGLAIASMGSLAAAIALPNLFAAFSCGGPPISEVESYVGSLSRAQEQYFNENSAFAASLEKLDAGVPKTTNDYKYSTRATERAAFNYGVSQSARKKGYVSAVFVVSNSRGKKAASEEPKTVTIMCKSNTSGTSQPADPVYQNGQASCGANTTEAYMY